MIKLNDLCDYLNTFLEVDRFKDFCPNGLQVEGKQDIQRIGTAVSASLETIEAAIESGVDALIVHHGMFWNKDSYRIIGAKRRKLLNLLQEEISLLAYHLPLDAHQTLGNNWKAAKDLSWKNLQPFGDYNGTPIGVRGEVPDMPLDIFAKSLQDYYQHPVGAAIGGKQTIRSVGLISGSAHNDISQAVDLGLDCFITGTSDEPIWHIAQEESINFFALGHSATETVGPKALGAHLVKKFGIQETFIDVPNPF